MSEAAFTLRASATRTQRRLDGGRVESRKLGARGIERHQMAGHPAQMLARRFRVVVNLIHEEEPALR